jgi:hypothetical protein
MTTITASWTMGPDSPDKYVIEEELSRILAEEIDNEIMLDMLVTGGWTKVELERLKDRHESIDIETWIDENCTGKHAKLGRTFVFEKKQDAEWFMLKWL